MMAKNEKKKWTKMFYYPTRRVHKLEILWFLANSSRYSDTIYLILLQTYCYSYLFCQAPYGNQFQKAWICST